jgi:hypothetical protein
VPVVQKKHRWHLTSKEARHQLGGIGPTTIYALVKEGEPPLVKIGRRSFVQADGLDDFLGRKRRKLLTGSRDTGPRRPAFVV